MSLCFLCSNLNPSILQSEPHFRWVPKPTRQLRIIQQRQAKRAFCGSIRAVEDGIGVLSPDDTVSVRNPVGETGNEDAVEDFHQGFNGVASTGAEETAQSSGLKKIERKKGAQVEENDDYDSRFTLRNGREVGSLLLCNLRFNFNFF